MSKECIILRAIPGGGKSTLANLLAGENGLIFESDSYMMVDGEYKFDFKKLGWAHKSCYEDFKKAVDNEAERVIVANTNTTRSEFGKYKKYAESKGYMVFVLIVENRHGFSNVHNVPAEALTKMEARLRKDIKLV